MIPMMPADINAEEYHVPCSQCQTTTKDWFDWFIIDTVILCKTCAIAYCQSSDEEEETRG